MEENQSVTVRIQNNNVPCVPRAVNWTFLKFYAIRFESRRHTVDRFYVGQERKRYSYAFLPCGIRRVVIWNEQQIRVFSPAKMRQCCLSVRARYGEDL